jgi:hypothetical protein
MNLSDALKIKTNMVNIGCSERNISTKYLNVGFWSHLSSDVIYKNPIQKNGALLANVDVLKRFPFDNESLSIIYQNGLIAKNEFSDSINFLSEAYRCLAIGGLFRLCEIDFNSITKAFSDDHYSVRDLCGQFFVTDKGLANTKFKQIVSQLPGLMFCEFSYLESELKKCGFKKIRRKLFLSSEMPDIKILEQPSPFDIYHSLCIECEK